MNKIKQKLTVSEIETAADILNIDIATIKAVLDVESRGSGFNKQGQPIILYERHIFYRRLDKLGYDVNTLSIDNEDILNPKWGSYGKYSDQYPKLRRAMLIAGVGHPDIEAAALESCSWGLFQIMGFHWKSLGYKSIDDFVHRMYESEFEQLLAFIKYIQVNKLERYLQEHDWAGFARRYNGPAYKRNKYDTKLAKAYKKYLA